MLPTEVMVFARRCFSFHLEPAQSRRELSRIQGGRWKLLCLTLRGDQWVVTDDEPAPDAMGLQQRNGASVWFLPTEEKLYHYLSLFQLEDHNTPPYAMISELKCLPRGVLHYNSFQLLEPGQVSWR